MNSSRVVHERARSVEPRLLAQPYQVQVDNARRGAFEELVDAISSARIAKQEHPAAIVAVKDRATGQFLIEVDL